MSKEEAKTQVVVPNTLLEILKWAPGYYELKKALLYHRDRCTESYLITGKLLCDAEKRKDYKHDGSGADNFYKWAEWEIGYKRTNVQRIMKNWKAVAKFIPKDIDLILSIDFSKLSMITPLLEDANEEGKYELLHMAAANSVKDLENNIREMKGGVPQDECEHKNVKTLEICKDCGKVLFNSEKDK